MEASWPYVKKLAQRSEQIGFDLTLIAELNLNDIKGVQAPSLDAWSTAAALAAVTERLELMVAVRPTFHLPALLAKQAANIDHISGGRLTLNVVSSWWADEAKKYGVGFEQHDDRYARTSEWLDVLHGVWSRDHFSYAGKYYRVEDNVLEPKPVAQPHPILYAGGESPAAKDLIAEKCDAYLMHGDPPERVGEKIADLRERRARHNLPPLKFGVAGYAIVRETDREAQDELKRITDVQPVRRGLCELPAMARGNAARTARFARRLFCFEPRTALRIGGHAGTSFRTPREIRSRWCRSGPACNSARNSKRWSVCATSVIRRNVSTGCARVGPAFPITQRSCLTGRHDSAR